MSDAHLSGRHRRAVRSGLLGLGLALGLAPVAQAQEPFVERIPNAYRDLTRSQQATTLPLTGDDEGLLLEVGFPFVYFGQTYTQVGVTTEGYLTFGVAVNPANEPIPSDTPPDAVIAPFWDDLDLRPSPGAKILIERWGVAGSRALTVQWQEVALKADPAARLSFQVVLFEGTNAVHLLYGAMLNGDGTSGIGRASGSSATIGFEAGDGRRGVQVAFEQAGVVTGASGAGTGVGGGTGGTGGTALVGLVNGGWALVTRPALPEGRGLGDLDGDGRVTVLDQSRQVELRSPRYRPGTTLELVAADVAPLDSNGALWGDGLLAVADRDVLSRVIVGRDTLPPYLSELMPGSPAPGQTLTVTGSGFDASDAARNVLVLTVTGGGTREVRAATVNPEGSRITLTLPAEARRGPAYVRVDRPAGARRTNARTLGVAGVPAILALSPDPAVIGQTVALAGLELPATPGQVTVTIGGQAATVLAVLDGPVTAAGATRIVTLTVPPGLTPGAHAVQVAVGDATSEPFSHRFGDLPVVVITAPTDDGVILDRFMVQGTVQDADLERYELAYAPLGREEDQDAWTTFHAGTAAVTSGNLGRFDPTMLLNGYYVLRARAVDRQGLATEDTVRVSVQGTMKLGHFTLAFTDLEVPVAGIAIRVVREYDSRRKTVGDFGVGWRLKLVSVDLEEDLDHGVILDNPLSERIEYRFDPTPDSNIAPRFYTVRFVPKDSRERSSLACELPEEMEGAQPIVVKDGVGNWFWFPAGTPFDPSIYRVTLLDGSVLRVHDRQDLLQVIKLDGNTLTVSPAGITHSSGKSVAFVRDAQDRITSVVDPRANPQTYTYDARGDLVRHKDPEGWETTFVYRSDHHMTEWLDPRGIRAQKNEYDDDGRLLATIDAKGRRMEFTHDLDGRRVVAEDRAGNLLVTTYDDAGRATEVVAGDGTKESFVYDAAGHMTSRTDRNGKVWTFEYDAAGNQTAQVDPLGNRIEYTFNARGKILTITDADDGVVTYDYDAQDRLTLVRNQEQEETRYTRNPQGKIATIQDPVGRVTRWDHDEHGYPTRKVEPNGQVTLYTTDENGNCTAETRVVTVPGQPSVRATTSFVYTKNNELAKVTHPDGRTVETAWGPLSKPIEVRDTAGHHRRMDYDELGNLQGTIFADGAVEVREYDPLGHLVAIEDDKGRRSCVVSPRGLTTSVTLADGTTLGLGYDPVGNLKLRKDGRGHDWTFEYDDAGRKTREVDPTGAPTVYEYDGKGNVLTRTDADQKKTTYHYDRVGRLVRIEHPDGRTTERTLDDVGRTTRLIDPSGKATDFTFALDGTTTSLTLLGGSASVTYDARGQVASHTDLNGHTTRFSYDPLTGRRVGRTLPGGGARAWEYDALGHPVKVTLEDGQALEVEHDPAGRLAFRGFPDGAAESWLYDTTGRLRTTSDPRGTTEYFSDDLGRLASRLDPDGARLTWRYDGAGNVKEIVTPSGSIAQAHDRADRLESVTDVSSRSTTYAYTPAGRLKTITRPNGVRTDVTVDALGRPQRVAHVGPGGPIAGYTYDYFADGNVQRATEDSGRVVTYAYDSRGRLSSESASVAGLTTTVAYTHDTGGNRLTRTTTRANGTTESITYAYDLDDRLLREDVTDTARTPATYQVAHSYDALGNLTLRAGPDGSATYVYDAIGRLTSAVVTAGSSTHSLVYRYDPQGLRVETEVDGAVVRHLVDANRPWSQVLEERDAAGQRVAGFVHGVLPVSETDASGRTLWLLQDGLLSTRLLVDEAGAVVGEIDYDAYGTPVRSVGARPEHGWVGERADPTTGLVYLRSRWVDPRTGRFMTRDTFEGWPDDPPSLHPYAYALGNPVNRIDPPGTFSFSLGAMLAFYIPLALMQHDRANKEREFASGQGALLMRETLASLIEEPNAQDLAALDVQRILTDATPVRVGNAAPSHLGEPRIEIAVTSLFGQKIYARSGSELLLAGARGPTGDTRSPSDRLAEDKRLYWDAGPQSQGKGWVLGHTVLGQEIVQWLEQRKKTGDVGDVRVGEVQIDATGAQVGHNLVDIQFTAVKTNVRWYVQLTGRQTVSQLERLLRNDPRGMALEVALTGTLQDFLAGLRGEGQQESAEQRFVVPPGARALSADETIAFRNLPPEPRYDTAMAGQGVIPATGEFVLSRTDLSAPGVGDAHFQLTRVYRSGVIFPDTSDFRLGHNWFFDWDERISGIPGSRDLLVVDSLGRIGSRYKADSKNFRKLRTRPTGQFSSVVAGIVGYVQLAQNGDLVQTSGNGYIERDRDGTLKKFDDGGWLVEKADRNGRVLRIVRDSQRRVRRVLDPVGRVYAFEYAAFVSKGLTPRTHVMLVKVTEVVAGQPGREIHYRYDDQLDLVEVISSDERVERYTYSKGKVHPALNHNLLTVTAPEQAASGGAPYLVNRYDDVQDYLGQHTFSFDRVLEQQLGGEKQVTYADGTQETVTAGGTTRLVYQDVIGELDIRDLDLATTSHTVTVFDRAEHRTFFSFNHMGAPLAAQDETNAVTAFRYNQDGLRILTNNVDGSQEHLFYDETNPNTTSNGNLLLRLILPGPSPSFPEPMPGRFVVTEYEYESVFNQVTRVSETRAFVPVTSPPVVARTPEERRAGVGEDLRSWALNRRTDDATFERYSTRTTYDYQEGTAPVPNLDLFGVIVTARRNLGDVNADLSTRPVNDAKNMRGNPVHVVRRRVRLESGSDEAQRLGAEEQVLQTFTQWNDQGQVLRTFDAEGNVTTNSYYAATEVSQGAFAGWLESVTVDDDPPAHMPEGSVRAATTPARKLKTTTRYSAFGYPRELVDPRGTVTRLTFTADGDLEQEVRDANGLAYTTHRRYDRNGKLTEQWVLNEQGAEIHRQKFTYDILDDLREEATQLDDGSWLSTRHTYDPRQLLSVSRLPEGNEVHRTYDPRQLLESEERGHRESDDRFVVLSRLEWKFDRSRNNVETKDATGGTTLMSYDGWNRLRNVLMETGAEEKRAYDLVGNLESVEQWGRLGAAPQQGHDPVGNSLLARTLFERDDDDRELRTIEELFVGAGEVGGGRRITTQREYDRLGRVVRESQPDGDTVRTTYDGAGRLLEVTDALGNKLQHEYDENGNPRVRRDVETSGLTTPQTFTVTTDFDPLDRPVLTRDDEGQTVRMTWDALDGLVTETDARGPVSGPASQNAPGNLTRHVYDKARRHVRTEVELRDGGTSAGALTPQPFNPDAKILLKTTYDKNGRAVAMTDDEGNVTQYRYDALDRVVQVTDAELAEWHYTFDGDGNLRESLDPNGTRVVRTYDTLDRLVQVAVTPGSRVEGTRQQTFVWDGLSRLIEATDDNGSGVGPVGSTSVVSRFSRLRRTFDSLSRQLTDEQDGRTFEYSYNDDDTRQICRYPSGRSIEYTHDSLDRLTVVGQRPLGAGPPQAVGSFSYFGPGRVAERTSGNGMVLRLKDAAGKPGYDRVRRPTRLAHDRGAAPFLGFRLGYDRSSDRTSVVREHDGLLEDHHDYDSTRRLVRTLFDRPTVPDQSPLPTPRVNRNLVRRSYELDGAGSWRGVSTVAVVDTGQGPATVALVATYSVNATNAYTRVTRRTLSQGPAEDVAPATTETLAYDRNGNLTQDRTRRFAYDAFNRLVRVQTATQETVYSYDATGRRTRAETAPLTTGAIVAVSFAHDGLRCVEERTTGGTRDGEVRTYVHGVGLDEILVSDVARVGTDSSVYWHHEDASGSTIALTNSAGDPVDESAYDEWGVPYFKDAAAHATSGNPVLFQGHRYDAESGLYFLRARSYDPVNGRFLQRDPLGVWGDPLNLGNPYTFAADNPVTQGDPLGLLTEIQLERGSHSAKEEISKIQAAREAKRSDWMWQLAGRFADPDYMKGVVREIELEGRLEATQKAFETAQNSWQWDAFEFCYMLLQMQSGSVFLAMNLEGMLNAAADFAVDPTGFILENGEDFARLMLGEYCFLAGTEVAMADGSRKPIERVQSGDLVKSADPLLGWTGAGEVGETFRNVTDRVAYVTFAPIKARPRAAHRVGLRRDESEAGEEDGDPPLAWGEVDLARRQTIRCTTHHPWWVEGAQDYLRADLLEPGDRLLLDDDGQGVVLRVHVRVECAEVFNFEVPGWHTYYTAAALGSGAACVHNVPKKWGVIYHRTKKGRRDYVGKADDWANFLRRQKAHNKKHKQRFKFTVLQRVKKSGTFVRRAEETWIRKKGGPASQGGTLANKRYEMTQEAYKKAKGRARKPT